MNRIECAPTPALAQNRPSACPDDGATASGLAASPKLTEHQCEAIKRRDHGDENAFRAFAAAFLALNRA
jgi:hypothetical protein